MREKSERSAGPPGEVKESASVPGVRSRRAGGVLRRELVVRRCGRAGRGGRPGAGGPRGGAGRGAAEGAGGQAVRPAVPVVRPTEVTASRATWVSPTVRVGW